MAAMRLTDRPIELAPVDVDGRTALWHFRRERGWIQAEAAEFFGVSKACYCRYEYGYTTTLGRANHIVRMTGGRIRYRDLIGNFMPEYA